MKKRMALLVLIASVALISINFQTIYASKVSAGKPCPGPKAAAKEGKVEFICRKIGNEYKWVVSIPTKDSNNLIYVWKPKDNVVNSTIQRRISSLRQPDRSVSVKIPIEVEGDVPKDAINSLRSQIDYLVAAFPEVFKTYSNSFFVYQTSKWAKQKAEANDCLIPSVLINPPPTMHSESVPCNQDSNNKYFGSFLNWASYKRYDPAPIRKVGGLDEWANQAAQEGGGASIQNYYSQSRDLGNGNPLPAWYEQGGQDLFTSIALAVQTRKWRQASLSQGQIFTCPGVSIKQTEFYGPETKSCEYTLGGIGVELLVALYGFDAPTKWFENIKLAPNQPKAVVRSAWEESFKNTFGDSLSDFYRWADAYAEYLGYFGTQKMPNDLIAKLNRINS